MLFGFFKLLNDFAELLLQECQSIGLNSVLSIPYVQSPCLKIICNAWELGAFTDVPEAIKDSSNEHALAQGVSEGLYQIPTKPVHFVDAVVAHSELECEEERCATEDHSVTRVCFLD